MFKKIMFFAILFIWASGFSFAAEIIQPEIPKRAEGQTDVLELRCEPLPVVRIGFIGAGNRGRQSIRRMSLTEGTEIVAICDLEKENLKKSQKYLKKSGRKEAEEYTGDDDWKKICERKDIDLIYISTHWDLHTPVAVYAMKQGKHAAVEVPAAVSVQECWQLVDTSEQTRRHCMMLENCNYDSFEMATLNMAQQGLFGEIVHAEAAYIHDLREMLFNEPGEGDSYWMQWRLKHNAKFNGNLYPTHGIGPVCHIMNIHRGDRMDYLVSVSSNPFGLTAYAKEKYGVDSPHAKESYKQGDMNTTVIRTLKGKTIMVQHDIISPRPYSRHHLISGTKGFAQKYPVNGLSFEPKAHAFLPDEELKALLKKYEHPFWKEIGEQAKKVEEHGGMDSIHSGMDYIMDYRLIYCLRKGLPLDQDVYDAAEWSSLVELTRISVENNGSPVAVPDFTRGAWDRLKSVTYCK